MDTKKVRKFVLLAVMAMAFVLVTFGIGLAQGTTVNVTLGFSEFKFDPAELNVPTGEAVTFNVSNTGQFPHNVTFVAPDGTESNLFAENVEPGQSATGTFTFNTAGDWRMYCPVGQHEERGMVGVVHVGAASAAQSAATPTTAAAGTMAEGTATPAATTDPNAAAQSQSTTSSTPATLPTTGANETFAAFAIVLFALLALFAGLRLRRTS